MPSNEAAAVIAGLSAIGGGAIVAASNYAVGRLRAREARRAELRRALVELYYILSRIDYKLRTEPQPGKIVQTFNKQMARRLPQLDYSIGLTRRRLLAPDTNRFVNEMHKALAAAALLSPLKLLPAMSAVAEVMEEANDRDSDWHDRWNKARSDLFVECRDLLGSGVLRTQAEPGEYPK
jgi:hypothetical protein